MAASAGDLTGRKKAELAKKHADEQAAKAEQVALATAEAKREFSDEVEEAVTKESQVVEPVDEPVSVGDVEQTDVDVEDPKMKKVEFRVNADLEDVTIGYGHTYTFLQGKKISAPQYIYDHLEEKGYIYH